MAQSAGSPGSSRSPSINLDEPYYVVLFAAPHAPDVYQPTVELSDVLTAYRKGLATLPLGFDRNMLPILPILLYVLQLPRTRFDLIRTPIKGTKTSQRLHLPHRIILVPHPWSAALLLRLNDNQPKLVFAEDNLFDAAHELARLISSVLEVVPTSTLSPALLSRHWEMLYEALRPGRPLHAVPRRLILDFANIAVLLPMLSAARKLRPDWEQEAPDGTTEADRTLSYSLDIQAQLSAIARLEERRTPPEEATRIYPNVLEDERARFTCPVAIGVPGVSPKAAPRLVANVLSKFGLLRPSDSEIETNILNFVVAHRALSNTGLAFVTQPIQDEAFHTLNALESLWKDRAPRALVVWRLLRKLGRLLAGAFRDVELATMTHAAPLVCFSEFPVGLTVIPGDTSPLCCRIPVVYRPLIPLTRAAILETLGVPTIHLRGRLSVLIAECIPETDIVGRLSRQAWPIASRFLREAPSATLRSADVHSLDELKALLRDDHYDVLVISAHGTHSGNKAGLIIGDQLILDQDLGRLPPIVCLSACQVAPRGAGTVNIADLMLRHGAAVVIGPVVPVDVRRNATLMVRFFNYLSDALRGIGGLKTLDALWQFVQTSNAVNDVVSGNQNIAAWARAGSRDSNVIKEFMLDRSPGHLRSGHFYADTEQVLADIARDHGILEKFQAWLRWPGYIPESLFYVMIGWPERVVFFDAEWLKVEDHYRTAQP